MSKNSAANDVHTFNSPYSFSHLLSPTHKYGNANNHSKTNETARPGEATLIKASSSIKAPSLKAHDCNKDNGASLDIGPVPVSTLTHPCANPNLNPKFVHHVPTLT